MENIGQVLSSCIKEAKWCDIEYQNIHGDITHYWIAIKDIFKNKTIRCDIVNVFDDKYKNKPLLNSSIYFDNIKSAKVLDNTYYKINDELILKLKNNPDDFTFLFFDSFNNNILEYIKECYEHDKDPFQKSFDMIEQIDAYRLAKENYITLNDKQFDKIVLEVFSNDYNEFKQKKKDLVINILSISQGNKLYVMAYKKIDFNPLDKVLIMKENEEIIFNKTFLCKENDNIPMSLKNFIDMDIDTFIKGFKEKPEEFKEILKEGLYHNQKIDDRPYVMLLERTFDLNLQPIIEEINQRHQNNTLNAPLKAFFGDFTVKDLRRRKPKIALVDNLANIDQVRVVYNSMKNPITYVKGPPGTGKTQTILNIVLSALINNKKVLICSNNNKPIDGICSKINNVFKYKGNDIPFPILRIGKEEENLKSLEKIKQYIIQSKDISIQDELLQKKKLHLEDNNKEIAILLDKYEQKNSLEDTIKGLKTWQNMLNENGKALYQKLQNQIDNLENEIFKIGNITNEDVRNKAFNAKEDSDFAQYINFTSFKNIKKLLSPSYKELIQILKIKDETEQNKEFNKYLKNDENVNKLLDVFPFIATTNYSASKIGSPKIHFDLCIMDEAGQCDIANSLFSLVRANELVLVGDTNQLEPVIVLDNELNKHYMKKYQISETYNYCENSIIKLMQRKDNISKSILLRYHYRCGEKIINFSNSLYYNNQLIIETKNFPKQLNFVNIHNTPNQIVRNAYVEEAQTIVEIIKKNNYQSCGIVTPFKNQATLINDLLIKQGIKNIKAGTIHSLQGDEKDVIILSTAISNNTSKGTYEWVKDNKQLLNVATTRAKEKLILVSDLKAIKNKSNEDSQLDKLLSYVVSNGEKMPTPLVDKLVFDKSNNSVNEKELFETLTQILSTRETLHVERNVPLINTLQNTDDLLPYEIEFAKKAEFDFVIYEKVRSIRYNLLFVELDGIEHINNFQSVQNDRIKEKIIRKSHVGKLIRISNQDTRRYEFIKQVIFKLVSDNEKKDDLTIFDLL